MLAALIVGISALHYLTTVQRDAYHDVYRRLYYLPIVLGGLWFSLRGGLITAGAVSLVYLPHVVFQWGHHHQVNLEQYLEILLYNVIGFVTGFLTQRERAQRLRYQQTAEHLEESYVALRRQADQMLEIEEQLRRADRLSALGELSAGIAHEIRNPLGSIRGTAEILQEAFEPTDPRYEFAQILVREVDRLDRVVQDVLTFARPAPPEESRFTVAELIEEVLTLARPPSHPGERQTDVQIADGLCLSGHREQLKQAFLNLVLNAQQAMPDGGTLTIRGDQASDGVRLSFADTGPGIPADAVTRIFNPFYTTRRDGTGLGLAITHRIVESHGGRIEVISPPGAGATFHLWFPPTQETAGRHVQ